MKTLISEKVKAILAAIDDLIDIKLLILEQGSKKTSEVAKQIKKYFNFHDLDYIIRILPTGGINIRK